MDSDQFIKELKDFIDSNVGHKFNNSDVDKRFYDKIYERQQSNKKTNVKAIKSVKKLVQYQIACKMLNYCCNDIPDYIYELTDFAYREKFRNMFSNIEYETPELRKINNPKINYINGEFFMDYNDDTIKLEYDNNIVIYSLVPMYTYIDIDENCWNFINYKCEAQLDSISISVPWEINGNVIYRKDSNTYKLSNVCFVATYDLSNISILGRYSGLSKSAWICEVALDGNRNNTESYRACDWPGSANIQRGRAYLVKNHNVITSIKCDWDGYYNAVTFDQLKELLEKLS